MLASPAVRKTTVIIRYDVKVSYLREILSFSWKERPTVTKCSALEGHVPRECDCMVQVLVLYTRITVCVTDCMSILLNEKCVVFK